MRRNRCTRGVTFDQIITSPLVRTRQTADILAEALEKAARRHQRRARLRAPAAVIQELTKHARKARRARGTQPNLGELAARLIGAKRPLEFKKGAICRMD